MKIKSLQIKHHAVTAACCAVLVLGVVAYMYFLSLSVVHVVMRKDALQQMGQLRSEIAYLESAYIEANHVISTRVATAEGFNEIKDKVFISATPDQNLVLRTTND